jgi:hypothetical protein
MVSRTAPNIDHFGAQFDGYQYAIEGSNNQTTWTPLFDATSVVGASEPFTLGSFTGTAPTRVNNVLTPGAGPGGTVGYALKDVNRRKLTPIQPVMPRFASAEFSQS